MKTTYPPKTILLKNEGRTSEFWLTALAVLIPLANEAFNLDIDAKIITNGVASVMALVAYIASRTWVKKDL